MRSTLVEGHLRAGVQDALATDHLRAMDEIAVLGTHPYKRSSGLAGGFPTATMESDSAEQEPLPTTGRWFEGGGDNGLGGARLWPLIGNAVEEHQFRCRC
jgi:hypothetical protein